VKGNGKLFARSFSAYDSDFRLIRQADEIIKNNYGQVGISPLLSIDFTKQPLLASG